MTKRVLKMVQQWRILNALVGPEPWKKHIWNKQKNYKKQLASPVHTESSVC